MLLSRKALKAVSGCLGFVANFGVFMWRFLEIAAPGCCSWKAASSLSYLTVSSAMQFLGFEPVLMAGMSRNHLFLCSLMGLQWNLLLISTQCHVLVAFIGRLTGAYALLAEGRDPALLQWAPPTQLQHPALPVPAHGKACSSAGPSLCSIISAYDWASQPAEPENVVFKNAPKSK